ncbi:MAG: hypothetical protein WBQ26_12710 [Gemmatimonadaceae bacterium]
MIRRDLSPDRELGDLLRRFEAPDRGTADQHRALKRRIEVAAAPLLAERAGSSWWEFTAVWARTLIPLGLATAVAALVLMVWSSHAGRLRSLREPVAGQDSLVGAAPRERTSQRLLDALVTPDLPGQK